MKIITIMCCCMMPCWGSDRFDDVEDSPQSVNKGFVLLDLAENETIFSNYLDALTQARIKAQIEKAKGEQSD